jgi:hypothetical protein
MKKSRFSLQLPLLFTDTSPHMTVNRKIPLRRVASRRAQIVTRATRHEHWTCSSKTAPVYYGPVWWGSCKFCRNETETEQHIICCCEALARQRYNVFGNPFVETKDISTASVRNMCLFIRGLLNLYSLEYLGLHNMPKAEVHPGHKLTGPEEE